MPPRPLKYAAASVILPVCPAYAHAPIAKWWVHGKRSIVPTVSPQSVIACAHWPTRKLIAQSLLPKPFQKIPPMRTPQSSECVKPNPGQPRWNWAGSDALNSWPKIWTP